jgi:predicted lipoprotein with Yx(FWY)xxD motif/predicted small secreted protein
MRKTSMLTTVLAAGVLVLSGCSSNTSPDSGTEADSATSSGSAASSVSSSAAGSSSAGSSSASAAALLTTADSDLGPIVVDSAGMTVYMFDKDTQGSGASSCSGQCLVAWPPVVAGSATPQVEGVTGAVGTITRDDGTVQATLDGWPLYYWQNDKAPGDTTGQGVQGVWWVLTPDGARVTTPPPA